MRNLRAIGAVVVLTLVCASLPANAGSIGAYFDGGMTNAVKPILTPFNINVVMTDVEDFVNAVEFQLQMPPNLIILSEEPFGTFYYNLGSNSASGAMIGFGECVPIMAGDREELVALRMTVMAAGTFTDGTLDIGGFPGPQGAAEPRYNSCFNVLTDMTSVPTTLTTAVSVAGDSWGAVKALYAGE